MAGKVLAMAKLSEIKRYRSQGLSDRAIARALGCSRNTIRRYAEREQQRETNTPLIRADLNATAVSGDGWVEHVCWKTVHEEAVKGTPLLVIWEELFEAGKAPVQYPGFWKQFNKRFPNLPISMHRVFAPGSRIEIDYCDGIDLLDPVLGGIRPTQLFVGVLCHSRYMFAEFTLSQQSEDFLFSHVRMFEWFRGVSQIVSPDNLRSAVTKTHRYDPVINQAYTRLASHYGFAVVPARVKTPKDKAIVERSIQIFQRWFYFRVRHRTFTSLIELNQCLKEHLIVFHGKQHRIFRKSRQEMYGSEKTALKALPEAPYHVAINKKARLYEDCHLVFEKCYYSAPYALRGKELDVWATATAVEIYDDATRVAFHPRSTHPGLYITKTEHYPPAHQAYGETTPASVREIAAKIGPNTKRLIENIFSDLHPLRYLRSAQGIVRLAKVYGAVSLEKAAAKANAFDQKSYRFIERILKNGQLESDDKISRPINRNPNPFLRGDGLLH